MQREDDMRKGKESFPSVEDMESSEARPATPKRRRTLAGTVDPLPAAVSKGKEKVEEIPAAAGSPAPEAATCGICLSDGGRSARGRIDSCEHYFCFVCIMEWAKVESRCPTCRRRFRCIRRPLVAGLFAAERVVDVPVRDQVYHPLGNESTAILDPYANVNCSICHDAGNEELLLLCDLCDSAAHTFCVGLGANVPEGDWYCPDCTIFRDEHSKATLDSDCGNQDISRNTRAVRMPKPHVSIFRLVSDETTSASSSRFPRIQVLGQQQNDDEAPSQDTSRREPQDYVPLMQRSSSCVSPVGETVQYTQARGADRGARTLRNCRDVHDRVQTMRENWNALRTGSLAFSSNLVNYGSKVCDRERNSSRVNSGTSQQPESLPVVSSGQTANAGASSNAHSNASSQDVDKAWKMLEIAKSVHGTRRSNRSNPSINSPRKSSVPVRAENLHSDSFVSKSEALAHNDVTTGLDQKKHFSLRLMHPEHEFFDPRKEASVSHKVKKLQNCHKGLPNGHLSYYLESSSAQQDRFLLQEDARGEEHRGVPVCHQPPVLRDTQDVSMHPGSGGHNLQLSKPIELSACKVESSDKKQSIRKITDGSSTCENVLANNVAISEVEKLSKFNSRFSSRDQQLNNRIMGSDTYVNGSLTRRDDSANNSAKSDVQALVKLNLKLLSGNQHLGADKFKEIARIATHTILAACGLEHSKSTARSFPSSICKHNDRVKQLRKSNLMSNSCRECFYSFVKDVVNCVLSEKYLSQP